MLEIDVREETQGSLVKLVPLPGKVSVPKLMHPLRNVPVVRTTAFDLTVIPPSKMTPWQVTAEPSSFDGVPSLVNRSSTDAARTLKFSVLLVK